MSDGSPIGGFNLDERSRAIFREIVDTYLDTGEPVGSRTISQRDDMNLSAATIRNVMSDLERMGLLDSPHTSAGRIPTHLGLRLFVDGLLEVGGLEERDRLDIEHRLSSSEKQLEDLLTEATGLLSGLSQCAGLVATPKYDTPIKHMEFVAVGAQQALAIIVSEDGSVENRLIETPAGMPPSVLLEASNFLNANIRGKTLAEAREDIQRATEKARLELNELTARLVDEGLAQWAGNTDPSSTLIIRGRSNLLEELDAAEDIERVRLLFDDLEHKQDLVQLIELAKDGPGVKVFIGSETKLFSMSGSSLIISPYIGKSQKIVGAIGVIGPTRLNYARIVPLVDYTAKVVGRLMSS